jgi:hypothetical protein
VEDESGHVGSPADVVKKIETLRSNLARRGYRQDNVRSMPVTNTKKNVLYHLVFVSKDEQGSKIWNSITRTDSRGQRDFFHGS